MKKKYIKPVTTFCNVSLMPVLAAASPGNSNWENGGGNGGSANKDNGNIDGSNNGNDFGGGTGAKQNNWSDWED